MAEGFSNPVVGGGGVLKRKAVRSPNYQPGILGWTVNEDGTAEFNDVDVRGVITLGDAGFPQIILRTNPNPVNPYGVIEFDPNDPDWGSNGALSQSVQSDGLPNERLQVSLSTGGGKAAMLVLSSASLDATVKGFVEVVAFKDDGVTSNTPLMVEGSRVTLRDVLVKLIGASFDSMQVGAGAAGSYYFEEYAIGAVSIASGAVATPATALIPLTLTKQRSDYGGAFNTTTAIWTCPESGTYTHNIQTAYSGGVAGSRVAVYGTLNGVSTSDPVLVNDIQDGSGRGRISASCTREFTIGDTVNYFVLQSTGAAQTIRAGTGSYISVRRVL